MNFLEIGQVVVLNPSKRGYELNEYINKYTALQLLKITSISSSSCRLTRSDGTVGDYALEDILPLNIYKSTIYPGILKFKEYLEKNPYITIFNANTRDITNTGVLYKTIYKTIITKKIHSIYNESTESFLVKDSYIVTLEDTFICIDPESERNRYSTSTPGIDLEPRRIQVSITSLMYHANASYFTEEEALTIITTKLKEYSDRLISAREIPRRFEKIAIEFFGKDNVDLVINSNDTKDLIIRFPEFVISNNRGESHIVRDLFIKLVLNSNNVLNHIPKGTRSTRTISEVTANYVHSHLSSCSGLPQFSDFCMGSSDLGITMSEMHNTDPSQYTEEKIEILMCLIDTYVKYESLEGGPYVHIRKIFAKNTNLPLIQEEDNKCASAFKAFLTNAEDIPHTYNTVIDNYVDVNLSNKVILEDMLLPYVSDTVIVENGIYYNPMAVTTLSSSVRNQIGSKSLIFKGVSIPYNIISDDQDKTQRGKKAPHPKITEYVRQKLFSEFNDYIHSKEKAYNTII